MKDKELNKLTISDLFVHMLESGESETVLDAIRKERGNETTTKTEAELLTERKNILKNITKK